MSEKLFRLLVVILLALIFIVQIGSPIIENIVLEDIHNPTEECMKAIDDAKALVDSQSSGIALLFSSYSQDVYNNSNVDNINKQILMASEYEFKSLQIIAKQNEALIGIQINCK